MLRSAREGASRGIAHESVSMPLGISLFDTDQTVDGRVIVAQDNRLQPRVEDAHSIGIDAMPFQSRIYARQQTRSRCGFGHSGDHKCRALSCLVGPPNFNCCKTGAQCIGDGKCKPWPGIAIHHIHQIDAAIRKPFANQGEKFPCHQMLGDCDVVKGIAYDDVEF